VAGDRALFLDMLAVGIEQHRARPLAGMTKKDVAAVAEQEPELYAVAKKAGGLARGAPHLVPEPEPLAEERWPEYLNLIAGGKRPSQAAREMGVRPVAVYLARQDSVRFADLERAAEGSIVEQVEDALIENALDGETKAALAFLEARAPERGYGRGGGGGVNIGTMNVNFDVDAARARLEEIRRERGEVIDID
jgi:hypothetical protein